MFAALLSAGASLVSGFLGKSSADKAAKLKNQADMAAIEEQRAARKEQRDLNAPIIARADRADPYIDAFLGLSRGDPDYAAKRAAADAAYRDSPWAINAREGADAAFHRGVDVFNSNSGATRSFNSGRAARGIYNLAQEAEDQNFREGFTPFFGELKDVSGKGFSARTGLANSAGQTAANISSILTRGGDDAAAYSIAGNNAITGGINGALYYLGQSRNKPDTTPAPSTRRTGGGVYGPDI